jgi:hypothetical protein
MAPRLEFSLGNLGVEFKPRTGTWASLDAWAYPSLKTLSSFDDESSSQQQRRRVRFAPRANSQIRDYIHVSDYSASEKDACWYRRPQYQTMREHSQQTLENMTYGIPLDPENESHFGLELQLPLENVRCQLIKYHAKWAVLNEQEDQLRYDFGLQHDLLASRYSSYTREAHDRARQLGYAQIIEVC